MVTKKSLPKGGLMINKRSGGNVSKQGAYHQERSGEKIEGEL